MTHRVQECGDPRFNAALPINASQLVNVLKTTACQVPAIMYTRPAYTNSKKAIRIAGIPPERHPFI